ncbi:MAG: 2-C-methyl-D-erythritol 4-phosphate cytidylyltransferase [Planctomycetota bacterium]
MSADQAKFCVIIPAAGKSERFGGEEKKSFVKLDGRPVFLRTIELFISRDDVCQTILAVSPEDMGTLRTQYGANLGFMDVQLVEGGPRRCDTVAAALKAVSPKADFVAVHDAARPCTAHDRIDAVFAEARKTAAAILACPIAGTIKRATPQRVIEETLSRISLYEAQTPQVFRANVLIDAYAKLSPMADDITDDSLVVERSGHPVSIVISDASNLKITTKSDLSLASAILKCRPHRPSTRMGIFEEAQW